jgi:hypothetical protein
MGYLIRTLTIFVAITPVAVAQTSDLAQIERRGDPAVLSVNSIATELELRFGIAVSAEDPLFQFRGDMMDISVEVPRVRPGTLVPGRWGFEVPFPVNPDGSPQNVRELLAAQGGQDDKEERARTEKFDPESSLVAASTRDGFIYLFHEDSPDKLTPVDPVKTEFGAKTMALDPKLHYLLVDTSDFDPPRPPTSEQPNPQPRPKPGTFRLLVYGR